MLPCFATDGQHRRTQCCRHNVSSFYQGLAVASVSHVSSCSQCASLQLRTYAFWAEARTWRGEEGGGRGRKGSVNSPSMSHIRQVPSFETVAILTNTINTVTPKSLLSASLRTSYRCVGWIVMLSYINDSPFMTEHLSDWDSWTHARWCWYITLDEPCGICRETEVVNSSRVALQFHRTRHLHEKKKPQTFNAQLLARWVMASWTQTACRGQKRDKNKRVTYPVWRWCLSKIPPQFCDCHGHLSYCDGCVCGPH